MMSCRPCHNNSPTLSPLDDIEVDSGEEIEQPVDQEYGVRNPKATLRSEVTVAEGSRRTLPDSSPLPELVPALRPR